MPTRSEASSATDASRSRRAHGPLFVVGVFPPPTTGMAVVNHEVVQALLRSGHTPVVIRLRGASLVRGVLYHIQRLLAVVHALVCFMMKVSLKGTCTVYLSVSGGYGKVYELAFLGVSRLVRARMFLHHHNYTYLYHRSRLANIVWQVAGRQAIHVVACEEQGRRLCILYPVVRQVMVLSTAAAVTTPHSTRESRRTEVGVLGYLGNISFEKGVREFLEVMRAMQSRGAAVRGVLAGPIPSRQVRRAVLGALRGLENTVYVGAKYGLEKDAFYRGVDVLLYPTWGDCAPLTIHEALSHSIPVVAWESGCIRTILEGDHGVAIPRSAGYADEAIRQLMQWGHAPHQFRRASESAGAWFAAERRVALGQLADLIERLTRPDA